MAREAPEAPRDLGPEPYRFLSLRNEVADNGDDAASHDDGNRDTNRKVAAATVMAPRRGARRRCKAFGPK